MSIAKKKRNIASLVPITKVIIRARKSLAICFENSEHLASELDIAIDSITVACERVSLLFDELDNDRFVVETRLRLESETGEAVGYYDYHEDQNEKYLDEFLVFSRR